MSANAAQAALGPEALSDLGRLHDRETLEEFFAGRPDLLTSTTVEQLAELVRQQVRVDVDHAFKLAEVAVWIAARLNDPASLGRSLRAKANALWFNGNCRAAVELFDAAVDHFEQAHNPAEIGRTLSSSIQPLLLLGEYLRALQAASKAHEIFSALGDNWRIARLELNVANIRHRQDRFAEALSSYERAYEALLSYKDAEGIGVALHNIAVCLIMLNDFDRALACYGRVRELCNTNGMPLLSLQADYNIAYLYFLRGDYDAAIESLCQTREVCREHGDAYHSALCNLDQAEIYVELNLNDEAARMADEAARQFEALGMPFETGRSVANLAIATHQRNNSALALELFANARNVFVRESNESWQALIDLYQSLVLCELKRHDEARRLCAQAREFFESSGLDRRAIVCDLLLARLSLESGAITDTRSRCLAVLKRLEALQAPLLAFQAHLLLGHAERICGARRQAYRSYNRARLQLEALRSSLQVEELKITFLKNKLDVYESLVEICLDQRTESSADRAFRYIEQAKSRSLAELVFGHTKPIGWRNVSGEVGERLRNLRGELNWRHRRIEVEQTSPEGISLERINQLRAEARDKEDEFLRMIREMQSKGGRPGVLDAAVTMQPAEIRAALHPDAVLVEYFQSGSTFVCAVASRSGTNVVRLAPVPQVTSHIRMLESQLSKFRLDSSYSKNFEGELLAAVQNRLRELYSDLIEPLASSLKARHLIVVPHGILHYVPFHALLDGSEYLIDRFTVSLAPSASIYAMCHRKPANTAGCSLLLGVQDKNTPWIAREIRAVAKVVSDPKVFLGAGATADLLRSVGPESRLIHIATHGIFRRDNPMFSSVKLADSHLSLYDLYDLTLPVELLTLSGCGTGLSVVAPGDELLGLIRGFLCAGAQSLLLSLWDVYDRTTAEFMTSFYAHLGQEQEKGIALRSAMLEVRKRRPHPYFWAPFVLVGKAFRSDN